MYTPFQSSVASQHILYIIENNPVKPPNLRAHCCEVGPQSRDVHMWPYLKQDLRQRLEAMFSKPSTG